MSDDRVEKFRAVREASAAMLASYDKAALTGLKAEVDQLMAAARDAGYGPEQAGALVQWGMAANIPDGGPGALMERMMPGWNAGVVLAVCLEVFDDAR